MKMKYLGPTKTSTIQCNWCGKKFTYKFIRQPKLSCSIKCKKAHQNQMHQKWVEKNRARARGYEAKRKILYRHRVIVFDDLPNYSLLIR